MKLSQILNGNWIITVANTEEEGWETQLAEFAIESTSEGSPARAALEAAAAAAFVALARGVGNHAEPPRVESHNRFEADRMKKACLALGFVPA